MHNILTFLQLNDLYKGCQPMRGNRGIYLDVLKEISLGHYGMFKSKHSI